MGIKPTVAIVGRPNVGKSTLVNRLTGSRKAIVDDQPGVTRDRIYFDVEWQGKEFTVIDTGGIIPGDEDEIMVSIFTQAQIACEEADSIVFIVDGKDGINPIDYDIANILRRSDKKVYLVVNKIDSPERFYMIADFYALSMGEPIGISALHGDTGVGDLLDMITEDIARNEEEKVEEEQIKIAVVGKPNAGKSSIINALLNEDRMIVSNVSGTTRDTIDSKVKYEGKNYILVDTAGIRKKAKVEWGVEKFAVDRAIRAIRDANIAVLVIDALEGLTDQDKKIFQITEEAGIGLIIAINKWDLVEDKQKNSPQNYEKKLSEEAPFLNYVPKIFVSAKTKQRLPYIYQEADKVFEQWKKRVSTSLLNKVISDAIAINPPATVKGKRLKVLYTTQAKSCPPTFAMFINSEKLLSDSYKRYLEKKLREAFGFFGTPIRLNIKERSEK